MYDLPIPEEPDDRSVVLDRESIAWQRRDDLAPSRRPELRWMRVGGSVTPKAWRHLLVDRGALAPMLAESSLEAEGWYRAGYLEPGCEAFRQTPDVPAPDARTPITAGEVREANGDPTGRQEADRRGFL